MQPSAGTAVSADLGIRFLAKLIDFILLGVVSFLVISTLIVGTFFGTSDASMFAMMDGLAPAGILSSVLSSLLYVAYFTFMESSRGQTVGKMVLNLRVEGPGGRDPSLEVAFKRNAWILLAIIPWLGGFAQLAAAIAIAVTIGSSPTNTGWHDDFAGGTRVVKGG